MKSHFCYFAAVWPSRQPAATNRPRPPESITPTWTPLRVLETTSPNTRPVIGPTCPHPHPLEYPMWGTVTKVSDENVKALAGLIKDIADHGGLNVAYDAFGIQPTDSLYVKPEDRVRIW